MICSPSHPVATLIGLSSSHSSIMTEQKKQLAIAAIVIWLLFVIFFMILARSLSLEIFFLLWLIGLLVIVELIVPAFRPVSWLQMEHSEDGTIAGSRAILPMFGP